AVDRRPVAFAAGCRTIDAALHDPQRALLGDRDLAGLGALDLGVAAPHDLDRASEKLCLGLRVDDRACDLLLVLSKRRREIAEGRALIDLGRPLGWGRGIERRWCLGRGLALGEGRCGDDKEREREGKALHWYLYTTVSFSHSQDRW